MRRKEKEEDRIERIIRGLLRLPENRRCINCNSLGPQYVCTTFLTFVCTNCSGVHREFTHRVKSVSMAKFTAEEVSSLQAGGNERARQIYFREWDPQRNSYPDGSNLHRLRDFIKHVYVDRRYSGERSHEIIPRLTLRDRDESSESRRFGAYCDGSRSPVYEDKFERRERSHASGRSDDRSLKYHYDERRSPHYSQENSRPRGSKRNPVRFEIVDDRFRDDKVRDNRRFSHRESGFGSLSPDRQKNVDQSSSPVVRSVKDLLGDNILSLRVGEHSKTNDRKDAVGFAQDQIIASSSSKESTGVQAVEEKNQNSESLIDFSTDSKTSDVVAAPERQEKHQSDGGSCPSNEPLAKHDAPPAPKPNTLEFLLLELSTPSVEPVGSVADTSNNDNPPLTTSGGNMLMGSGDSVAVPLGQLIALPDNTDTSTNIYGGIVPVSGASPAASVGQMLALPSSVDASATVSGGNMPSENVTQASSMGQMSKPSNSSGVNESTSGDAIVAIDISPTSPVDKTLLLLDARTSSPTSLPMQPSSEGSLQIVSDVQGDSTCKVPNEQHISIIQQHQLSAFPAVVDGTSEQQTSPTTIDVLSNKPWTSINMTNTQGPSSASAEHPSQSVAISQDSYSGINAQNLPLETKSSGRKELPADLFATSFSPVPRPIPGWQSALPYNTGFGMQYNPNVVPSLPYPNPPKSSNPFDLNNESTSIQASQFPSMGNLGAALPSVSAPGDLAHTSSIDTNNTGSMATQAPYFPSGMPLHSPSFAPATADPYMGALHMNMLPSGVQGANSGFGIYGSLNMIQQSPSGHQLPTPNSLPSTGGNPFG